MFLDLTERQLFLLYYLSENLLLPVDKLVNREELSEILHVYTFKGATYSLPYLFFVSAEIPAGTQVTCRYLGREVARIRSGGTYSIDFLETAERIFLTADKAHPGVHDFLANSGKYCLSGNIQWFDKRIIASLGIPYLNLSRIPTHAFQSRNPPHKAHESIILEHKENLLYSTPYETTKAGDYPFALKIKCYEKIRDLYGCELWVTLLPRVFAGPREALQNMLLFRNLGCTHFIGGRGKNCVGTYYGDTESMDFCRSYAQELGMHVLQEPTHYASGEELSASALKATYIDRGSIPPEELMSPYISEILIHG